MVSETYKGSIELWVSRVKRLLTEDYNRYLRPCKAASMRKLRHLNAAKHTEELGKKHIYIHA